MDHYEVRSIADDAARSAVREVRGDLEFEIRRLSDRIDDLQSAVREIRDALYRKADAT
jgi:hypothetical protein